VTSFSLFEKTSPFGGVYVMFMVNRLQMIYFVLIMPMYLVQPSMIWAIVAIGLLSQLNLMMVAKWFSSDFSAKGYQGFVELFGERAIRFFALAGLFLIFIKISVITMGYVEILHTFMFPSMNHNWLILFLVLTSFYIAAKGMEKTIRFVIIAFLCTVWMIAFFYPFFIKPIASLYDLYPLIPTEWSANSWKALLFIWSSLSGPEYLICLSPWIKPKQNMIKYVTFANIFSVLEYLIVFIGSLFFFGSNYLSKTNFPVVHMMRYLQSPIFERVDLILISIHMFHVMFALSLLLLCWYGAFRIMAGRLHEQTTPIGFLSSCLMMYLCLVIVNQSFWNAGVTENTWLDFQIWVGAFTYFLVPAFLLAAIKARGRV
jgi:hypothetical protein